MTVQERVRQFVLEYFYVSDPAELTDEISLIDSGIVDSTGMLEIILFPLKKNLSISWFMNCAHLWPLPLAVLSVWVYKRHP